MNYLEHIPDIEIREKYLKPPSFDEIFSFISELGVSYSQFERYYSIPYGVIRHVKRRVRPLPVKFWPIIYERIVPQYGIKFMNVTKVATKASHVVPKSLSIESELDTENHDRLVTVK